LAVEKLRAVLQALETATSPDAYPGCGLEFAKPRSGSTAVFPSEILQSAFRQRELLQHQNEKRRPAVKEVARSGDRARRFGARPLERRRHAGKVLADQVTNDTLAAVVKYKRRNAVGHELRLCVANGPPVLTELRARLIAGRGEDGIIKRWNSLLNTKSAASRFE
jgi:hypothetical protein